MALSTCCSPMREALAGSSDSTRLLVATIKVPGGLALWQAERVRSSREIGPKASRPRGTDQDKREAAAGITPKGRGTPFKGTASTRPIEMEGLHRPRGSRAEGSAGPGQVASGGATHLAEGQFEHG